MTQTEKSKRTKLAAKYIDAIRNVAKRQYARQYWHYLIGFEREPQRPNLSELSYMAAQAVELRLGAIWNA